MKFNVICLQFFSPVCLYLSYLGQQTCSPSGPASPWTSRILHVPPSAFSLPVFILFIMMFSSISVFLAKTKKKKKISSINSDPLGLNCTFFPNVRAYMEKKKKNQRFQ